MLLLNYCVQSAVYEGNNSYALAEYWCICNRPCEPHPQFFDMAHDYILMILCYLYWVVKFLHVKQKDGSLALFPSLLDAKARPSSISLKGHWDRLLRLTLVSCYCISQVGPDCKVIIFPRDELDKANKDKKHYPSGFQVWDTLVG